MEILFIVIFFILGICIASFLNVCIDRLPRNESLIFPASHCDSCHHRLAIKENIPVFSYLWLRGRCRYCQAPIPRRMLWVEIGTGILFGFTYWHYEFSSELAIALFYICLFIVILVIDLEHRLILNKIVFPAIVVALLISTFFTIFSTQSEIVPEIGDAASGGGIGLVLFLLVAIISRGGMGWGDVKLAALIGLVTGLPLVFVALLMGIILGGVVAVLLLAFKIKRRKEAIPFAPFLSLATIATLLWGNEILNWYLDLF